MQAVRSLKKSWSVFDSYLFVMGEQVAQGAHGAIFKTELQQGDVVERAVAKRLFSHDASDNVPLQFQIQRKLTEKYRTNDESGLLKLLAIHKTSEKIYLAVMPECQFTLHQAMPVILSLSRKTDLESKQLYHRLLFGFFSSMVQALSTLDEHQVVHCDLKPENIGLSPDHHPEGQVKWVLFDYSSAKYSSDQDQSIILRGTLKYMSPEAVTENQHMLSGDIWSFACILIEMMRLASDNENQNEAAFPEIQVTLKHIETLESEKKQLMRDPKGLKYLKIARLQDSPLPERSKFLIDRKSKDITDEFKKNVCKVSDFFSCLKIIVASMHQPLRELRATLPLLITAIIQLQKRIPAARESRNDRCTFQAMVRAHLMQAKHERKFSSGDSFHLTIRSDDDPPIAPIALFGNL